MKEANIAEVTKRNILSNANYRCEVCGAVLGYGEDEKRPHFHYIIPPLQGGDTSLFNVTVLCPEDSARFHKLSKEDLKQKAMDRENYYDLS